MQNNDINKINSNCENLVYCSNDNVPIILKTSTMTNVYKQERDEFSPNINILNTSSFLDIREMLEEDRLDNEIALLQNKVKSGEPLTARELALLKKHAPLLYNLAIEIQFAKELFEQQLKKCSSKEEVERLMTTTMLVSISQIKNSTGPAKEKAEIMLNVYKKVLREFKESEEYQQLKDKDSNN